MSKKVFTFEPKNILEKLSETLIQQIKEASQNNGISDRMVEAAGKYISEKINLDEPQNTTVQKRKIKNEPQTAKLVIPHWYLNEISKALNWINEYSRTSEASQFSKIKSKGIKKGKNDIIIQHSLKMVLDVLIDKVRKNLEGIVLYERERAKIDRKKEIIDTLYGRNIYLDGKRINIRYAVDTFEEYWRLSESDNTMILENLLQLGIAFSALARKMYYSNSKIEDLSEVGLSMLLRKMVNSKSQKIHEREREGIDVASIEFKRWAEAFDYRTLDTEEVQDIANNEKYYFKEGKKADIKESTQQDIVNISKVIIDAIITGYITIGRVKDKAELSSDDILEILSTHRENKELALELEKKLRKMIYILTGDDQNGVSFQEKIQESLRKVSQIDEQIGQYKALKSADRPFDSIEINFDGKLAQTDFHYKIDNFHAKKGEVIYISGNSGNGKSTFVKMMYGGDLMARDIITIDGKEKVDCLKNQAIILSKGESGSPSGMSIEQKITGKIKISDEDRALLFEALNEAQINIKNTADNQEKSLGQQERLLIAKFLYRIKKDKKSIVFLDEPIGQVQSDLKEKLMQVLTNCAKKYGVIVILTSHEKELAEKYSDRVYEVSGKDKEPRCLKEVSRNKDIAISL